jgi:hypothetical protein
MTDIKQKPKNLNSASEKELDKVAQQFDKFEAEVKEMTMDRMNMAPKEEVEPQTKLSQNEIAATKDHYLKPHKVISCREKFNEKYRDEYNYQKEYVNFIAEHKELIGESIDIWTRPFPGMPAEEWIVPTNTPVWGPRYLAEQIKRKFYHRLIMKENVATETTGMGVIYGKMAADTTIQRLDAQPVTKRKSVFMGDKQF